MKKTGTKDWTYPYSKPTNKSGFSAVESNLRDYDGVFIITDVGSHGSAEFWSSSVVENSTNAYNAELVDYSSCCIIGGYTKQAGKSVRCIKD